MAFPPDQSNQDPRDRAIVEWVSRHRTPGEPAFDVDAAYTRFSASTARPRWTARAWQIAALIVVAAGLGYWKLRPAERANVVERVAANGERVAVTLDDGTRITLNGGSRLRYPEHASGDRDVQLEGEAFFEVTHDARRAFRVHTTRGVVQDVGTKFNVRAYVGEPSVQVAVAEGIVALRGDSLAGSVTLNAGDVGVLDSAGVPAVAARGSLDRYIGWTTGGLVFDDVTLRDAALAIERRYGVRVVVADSTLAGRKVAGRFHGETAAQVLDAITLALGARYETRGTTYIISAAAARSR